MLKKASVFIFIFSLVFLTAGSQQSLPKPEDISSSLFPIQDIGGWQAGTFISGKPIQLHFQVYNHFSDDIEGTVVCNFYDQNQNVVETIEQAVLLSSKMNQSIYFSFLPKQPGFYNTKVVFKNQHAWLNVNQIKVAYGLEKWDSQINQPDDFWEFWDQTLLKIENIDPDYKVIAKEELWTEDYKVFLVEMKSLHNYTIRGWYRIPRNNWNAPVVLQLPGLGNTMTVAESIEKDSFMGVPYDFAVFSLNIRGHGNSRDDLDIPIDNYFTHNLESLDDYVYRGAIADGLQAIEFLSSKGELNPEQIIVEGPSQGGGLAMILAALDNRVRLCAPDVPFLSDFDSYFAKETWVSKQVKTYVAEQPNLTSWRAQFHLRYFDTKNFVEDIECPVLMSVGMEDLTCPPETALVSFAQIQSPKTLVTYLKTRHTGGGKIQRQRKFEWIRQELNYY